MPFLMPQTVRVTDNEKEPVLEPFEIEGACKKLHDKWGAQHWWPGESRTEVIAGAVLAQATNWRNASLAVKNLKSRGLLEDSAESMSSLVALSQEELAGLVRSSGYFRQKARRLQTLMKFLAGELGAPPWSIPRDEMSAWRRALLEVNGLGPETVDSILLYGFGLPVFVVDAYTRRMLSRHGMIAERTSYEEIRLMFESKLPKDARVYNEYHALIVRLGKEHCASVARCAGCPVLT